MGPTTCYEAYENLGRVGTNLTEMLHRFCVKLLDKRYDRSTD